LIDLIIYETGKVAAL